MHQFRPLYLVYWPLVTTLPLRYPAKKICGSRATHGNETDAPW